MQSFRALQRRWIVLRVIALDFRTSRASHGLFAAIDSLLAGVLERSSELGAADTRILDAEIVTLRETVAFLDVRRQTRLAFAIAAEKATDRELLTQVIVELQVIESELNELQRRLSVAAYKRSIRESNSGFLGHGLAEHDPLRRVLAELVAKRESPTASIELKDVIDQALEVAARWRA